MLYEFFIPWDSEQAENVADFFIMCPQNTEDPWNRQIVLKKRKKQCLPT